MTIQIAVKLPDDLVGQIDRLVERGAFDSRLQAVRTGLAAIIADRRRQELDDRYRASMPVSHARRCTPEARPAQYANSCDAVAIRVGHLDARHAAVLPLGLGHAGLAQGRPALGRPPLHWP